MTAVRVFKTLDQNRSKESRISGLLHTEGFCRRRGIEEERIRERGRGLAHLGLREREAISTSARSCEAPASGSNSQCYQPADVIFPSRHPSPLAFLRYFRLPHSLLREKYSRSCSSISISISTMAIPGRETQAGFLKWDHRLK